ncbi:receptor-type tyrosine-protein phosphatase epsilon isoform X7 [Bubalus bubalis]|uniref:receptor-type tyrosine-protein phosphatase epsilon isoform X7 n=1 Tax=Bubalus bubalis TaxID=89462 RepID=UPI001D12B5D0|nr:receptor-type tyrosine-protein phosphatase epsilon isoform X7 [Bubalus bubalis]
MNYSPPGSPVHGILQARMPEWVAMPTSSGPSCESTPLNLTHDPLCFRALSIQHTSVCLRLSSPGARAGPKQETVNDFWRMIWEQKCATIVMLTNLKERKEEKCYQYWPDQGCWTYGNIRVCVEDCVVLVDYTIRKFCIQSQLPDGCKAPRLVCQLHFTSWPDFGVPFTPIGMLKFLKKVRTLNPAHAGPIVVHCSAGVGRTGTFIVIDAMMDMMHAEQKVDVFDFVSRIRNQRPQMVQTDMQYTFIYQALLEYYLYGDTELDVSSLEKHLQALHGPTAHFDKIGLEEEFRKLTNVRIMKENMRTGNLPANMKKARVIQIIPYDFNRVILSMKRGQEYTDYINASFIDGYRQKDYFIATQGPLAHTVQDFWRMVWECKCHAIVMLTEVQEREQDKCYQYWPTEGSVTHGEITIEIKSDTLSEAISIRDFLVTFNQPLARPEEQTRMVRQFHFHGWPEIGIPAEGKGMIDLIAAVQKQQQQTGNHPITVHCSAGAGRTGTFIALSNILERVKAEGLLDVFQAVKSLRLQRPHMVQTLEQYEFCYKVVRGQRRSPAGQTKAQLCGCCHATSCSPGLLTQPTAAPSLLGALVMILGQRGTQRELRKTHQVASFVSIVKVPSPKSFFD